MLDIEGDYLVGRAQEYRADKQKARAEADERNRRLVLKRVREQMTDIFGLDFKDNVAEEEWKLVSGRTSEDAPRWGEVTDKWQSRPVATVNTGDVVIVARHKGGIFRPWRLYARGTELEPGFAETNTVDGGFSEHTDLGIPFKNMAEFAAALDQIEEQRLLDSVPAVP